MYGYLRFFEAWAVSLAAIMNDLSAVPCEDDWKGEGWYMVDYDESYTYAGDNHVDAINFVWEIMETTGELAC